MTTLKLGDSVAWESQAGGNYRRKEGKVVCTITEENPRTPRELANIFFPKHQHMFDGYSIPWKRKNKTTYLVEVLNGPRAKPKLYMPHPQKLKKQKPLPK